MDLAADPELRARVEVARSWGVPLSRLMGRPLVTVTEYVYDANGRVARAVASTEEWTDEDVDAAFALAAYEADRCPGCRGQLTETTAPESEWAYIAEPAIRCHRCTAQAVAGEQYRENPQPQALFVQLRHRTEVRDDASAGEEPGPGAAVAGPESDRSG